MSETTALAVIAQDPDRSLQFIETIGERLTLGLKGVKNKATATAVALQMLCEGLSPVEFESRYHVLDGGGFQHRAEYVHAEMMRRGWSVNWTRDGEDGKTATARFSKNGEATDVSFSIELAKKKGLIRSGSQWTSDPALMLRSRVITRAATMLEPSIGAGMADDADARGSTVVESTVQPSATETTPTIANPEFVDPSEQPKVTLDSMTSAIDFPKRAFTSFNLVNERTAKITTIGELCAYTYDQLLAREKLGKGTLDQIVAKLAEHNCSLAENKSGDGDGATADASTGTDAMPSESTAGSTDAALAAKGEELAADTDANHLDSEHGAAIAELRQICTAVDSKAFALNWMEKLFSKKSLHDLSSMEAHIVLMCLLARAAGAESQIQKAVESVQSASVPIERCKANLDALRKKIKN